MKIIPTILCGGAGSRLWPVSREHHPKPFIRLADGQSLLQKAFLRGAVLDDVVDVLTVTNREFFFKTLDEIQEVNSVGIKTSFILEPFGRNTAAAIAAAALQVQERHGADAVMLVLSADHMILDQSAFSAAVIEAKNLAEAGKLVTFGIKPDRPETGYGYIEADGSNVVQFVEKPNLKTAQAYVNSGRFLWNAGVFCFTAGSLLSQMQMHCSEILSATRECIGKSRLAEGSGYCQLDLNSESFKGVPSQSIDVALMEKSRVVSVVPCEIGWSDIGSWVSLGDLGDVDANGNRVQGEAILYNTENCTVHSDSRVVGTVGVRDLVIIDTPDALLVADRSSVQDVKQIYASLQKQGNDAYKVHRTAHRPWGTSTLVEDGPGYKIKRIEVRPGASLTLQMHHHRSEHWIVVSGIAKVTNHDQVQFVRTSESTFIAAGHRHRLENPGLLKLVMIEVQSGAYLGEDDIVRYGDVYDRAGE